MKLATSPIYASVTGDLGSVQMIPGSIVDLDRVIGHKGGKPVTVAAELGDLLAGFVPVDTDDTRKPARRAPQPPAPVADDKE